MSLVDTIEYTVVSDFINNILNIIVEKYGNIIIKDIRDFPIMHINRILMDTRTHLCMYILVYLSDYEGHNAGDILVYKQIDNNMMIGHVEIYKGTICNPDCDINMISSIEKCIDTSK